MVVFAYMAAFVSFQALIFGVYIIYNETNSPTLRPGQKAGTYTPEKLFGMSCVGLGFELLLVALYLGDFGDAYWFGAAVGWLLVFIPWALPNRSPKEH